MAPILYNTLDKGIPVVNNKLIFNGTWNEVQGKLKRKYGQLTDNDLVFTEGQDDKSLGRLQKKLGKAQDEVIKIIAEI